jgi:hypothetical protein
MVKQRSHGRSRKRSYQGLTAEFAQADGTASLQAVAYGYHNADTFDCRRRGDEIWRGVPSVDETDLAPTGAN